MGLRLMYSVGFALAMPWVILRLLWRSRHNKAYRQRWSERLGLASIKQKKHGIWLHTVSMGESIGATAFIEAILQQAPDVPVTVTTMTITGSDYIRKTFGDRIGHQYIPYDFFWMQKRFLKALCPRIVIIFETELWPNMLAACQRQQVPVFLANGRLSERSMQRYQIIGPLVRAMLKAIDLMAVQEPAHQARFVALGMQSDRIQVTGSLKYDVTISTQTQTQGQRLRQMVGNTRRMWIAASTHEGEEAIVLQAHRLIQQTLPNALLVLVPRHPERFDAVYHDATKAGFDVARYTETANWQGVQMADMDVILGDVMGQLLTLYASCDAAFIGGSLIEHGGHNPLEAAALGLPMATGMHMYNFTQITQQLRKAGVLQQVSSAQTLADCLMSWLCAPAVQMQGLQEQAKALVRQNRGATDKHIQLVWPYLDLDQAGDRPIASHAK